MGTTFDKPTPAQMEQMRKLVDEAMNDGALGLSSHAGQAPGLVDHHRRYRRVCAKSSAKHGGIFSSHIRNEGTEVLKAVNEAIAIGEQAHIPVDIIHMKIAEQKLWGRMNKIVA